MIDLDRLRRALVLGALGAVAMALVLPSLAALRYTDAHDWYAARKASVAEALIAVGFDENAATDFPDTRLGIKYGLTYLAPTTKGLPWAKA